MCQLACGFFRAAGNEDPAGSGRTPVSPLITETNLDKGLAQTATPRGSLLQGRPTCVARLTPNDNTCSFYPPGTHTLLPRDAPGTLSPSLGADGPAEDPAQKALSDSSPKQSHRPAGSLHRTCSRTFRSQTGTMKSFLREQLGRILWTGDLGFVS